MTQLIAFRGDTITLDIGPVTDPDGNVQNITGHTVKFTARDRVGDVAAVLEADGEIVDGPAGLASVEIPAAATDAFTADRVLVWDVQLTDPDGRRRTVDSGTLQVRRDVTRT